MEGTDSSTKAGSGELSTLEPFLRTPPTGTAAMRQSELCTRTSHHSAKEEISVNAQLLTRAGFVSRLMAGVYSLLPLGARVLAKIESIIRQEMNALGSQELLMPALQPRELWDTTGRWETVDVLFKLRGTGNRELALGATHEEVVTPLMGQFILSYKDLPFSVFQIQTKFRNEPRAKSGLLRGREFRMKDLYSFHREQADLDQFYERALEAYMKIFARCGIGDVTFPTLASGGAFSAQYSHEFQTLTPHGEDFIYICKERRLAINREVFEEVRALSEWRGAEFEEMKAIEVGNIFKLGTRYSEPFAVNYSDAAGRHQQVQMGCYGIGSTRLMGTVVEVLHDERGMIWPSEIAPYTMHLISLFPERARAAEEVFEFLRKAGVETLYDDRMASAGEKLKDADLIGLPLRVVISPRSMKQQAVELTVRASGKTANVGLESFRQLVGCPG